MRKTARMPALLFTLIGSACFEDSGKSSGADCTPGARACDCDGGSCGAGLTCRSEVCVDPACMPGAPYCNCDPRLGCEPGLECRDGRVCIPPAPDGETGTSSTGAAEGSISGSGSGSTAAGDSGSTGGAESDSDRGTAGGDPGSGDGGTGETSTGGEASSSTGGADGCRSDAECLGLLHYCDFDDGKCGAGLAGRCRLRPDLLCPPGAPVLGCDCGSYVSECEAHRKGTDVYLCDGSVEPCACGSSE